MDWTLFLALILYLSGFTIVAAISLGSPRNALEDLALALLWPLWVVVMALVVVLQILHKE